MLKIELEELMETLDEWIKINTEREKKHEITNYTKLENDALLTTEVQGIKKLITYLASYNPDTYSHCDDLIADLEKKFWDLIKKSDSPDAVYYIVKRKINKLSRYMETVDTF
jgi:hypothetical protein